MSTPTGQALRPIHKKIFCLLIGLSLIALFFHIADFSWKDVFERITGAGWYILFGVTFFTTTLYYMSALKWKYIVGDLNGGVSIPIGYLFHYSAMGYLIALVVPQAVSDVGIRSLYLKRSHKIPLKLGVYSILLDQFFNVMISSIFILPAVLFLSKVFSIGMTLAFTLLVTGFFFVIFWRYNRIILMGIARMYSWIVELWYRIPLLKLRRLPETHLNNVNFSIDLEIARKLMVFTIIRHFLIVVRLYVIIVVFELNISFFILFLCGSLMLPFGLIAFIPGQLGLGELGWYGALSLAGISDPEIVLFVISMRIFSTLAIILTGAMSGLIFRIFTRRIGGSLTEEAADPSTASK